MKLVLLKVVRSAVILITAVWGGFIEPLCLFTIYAYASRPSMPLSINRMHDAHNQIRASPSLKTINSRKCTHIAMAYCMWPTWWANSHPVTGGGADSVLTTLTTACLHMDGLQGRVTLWVIWCRPWGWRSWKSQVNVYTFNINKGSTSLLCHWKINAHVWDTQRYQSALFLFRNLNK